MKEKLRVATRLQLKLTQGEVGAWLPHVQPSEMNKVMESYRCDLLSDAEGIFEAAKVKDGNVERNLATSQCRPHWSHERLRSGS